MSEQPTATIRRIHIGNISPKLAENVESFAARLGKFGTVTSPLELRSKPVNDFYFGFITMELTDREFDKLKGSLNGIVFMGLKLTISLAKPNFDAKWQQDQQRPDSQKHDRVKRDRIAEARQARIQESQTLYPVNRLTQNLIHPTGSSAISANSSSLGYMKSPHVYNDNAANTKHKPPTHNLVGGKSYGSLTASTKVTTSQYSRTSGHGEVIKGRHRKTMRPHIYFLKKEQTMRTNINGELKLIKAYKTKLWGMEKNRTVKDLTWRYHNGVWKSGDDHIVERINVRKLTNEALTIPSAEIDSTTRAQEDDTEVLDEEAELLRQEKLKNSAVLASLFNKYDFDKPLEIEEGTGVDTNDITYDSKGRRVVKGYDYEIAGKVGDDDDNNSDSDDSFDYNQIQAYKEQHDRPQEEQYFDEDDEGNDLDLDKLGQQYTTEAHSNRYDEEHGLEAPQEEQAAEQQTKDSEQQLDQAAVDDESEDEPMPTFGQSTKPVINDTETLRSLFNPADSRKDTKTESAGASGFKLALSDDEDIDNNLIPNEEEQQKLLEQIKIKQREQEEEVISTIKHRKLGLFWPHFDSPFLQTQSQLNKIGNVDEHIRLPGEEEDADIGESREDGQESPYEKWFWSHRGELMRECKRRKRDVSRTFKRKHTKAIL